MAAIGIGITVLRDGTLRKTLKTLSTSPWTSHTLTLEPEGRGIRFPVVPSLLNARMAVGQPCGCGMSNGMAVATVVRCGCVQTFDDQLTVE